MKPENIKDFIRWLDKNAEVNRDNATKSAITFTLTKMPGAEVDYHAHDQRSDVFEKAAAKAREMLMEIHELGDV